MGEVKYRHELKYLISQGQHELLRRRLDGLIPLDANAGEKGMYNIRSLYFDDYLDHCYYDNLAGVDPREKYRIRIYNGSDKRISLECKRKEGGKTLKKSCRLSREQCEELMKGHPPVKLGEQPLVMRKLGLEMHLHHMKPAIIVDYDRIPYTYKDGNVRITLDSNVSSSLALDQFLTGVIPKRPVMPQGMQLLEVKYDEFLPDFIYRALQLDSLKQTAYSKYFLCREYTMQYRRPAK